MAESIDQLQIDINAQANRANKVIDTLCSKIDRLTVSMNRLDGSKLGVLANGVQRLGTAMQTMNNVKTADFTRLAKNLQTLNNLDVSKLSNLSVNVKHIATAFNGLSGMEESAKQMTALASGIKQLGYSSAEKAIKNIPLLATAMKKLMSELSTAPKVSQNLIDMTNALAKLARTGSSSGKAANSLVSSFNRISKASSGMKVGLLSAVNGISAIRKSILQAMGIAGGFYTVFQGIKESINIASDLTEVQNVVDVTFGDFKSKIEDLAKVSIPELGMSELTTKQIASRFQAMGTAMGIAQGNMADMSVEITRLAGDMASFYNVEQKAVGEDLEAIFTGQTKPLRQYGLDLTEATLQEWAMKQGIDANINSMSQMEKTMLRYQYVMANTGAAQGDFVRTADTWANQVRVLKENFKALGSVMGSTFINALKPLVKALNSAMSHIISFAKVVSNALGKIFGWTYEENSGGIAQDYEDIADSSEDLATGTGKAADNAKKLKQQLQGFDELNVLSSNQDTGSGGGSGSGGGATGEADASGGQWVKADSILKDYESQLDTLYKLGEHIGETLTNAMKSIDWESIYQGAKNFGSGLASFLNGLISPELFGEVGKTIAASLNTALYALNSFGKTFDWKDFGESIASGINNFFSTFDFGALAQTLNVWADGLIDLIGTSIKEIDKGAILDAFIDFFGNLELDTVAIVIGAVTIKKIGKVAWGFALGTVLKPLAHTFLLNLGATLTADVGAVLGAGTFAGIAATIGFGIVGALTSWFAGQEVGKLIGRLIFPEDADWYKDFSWFGEDGFFKTILIDLETSLDGLSKMLTDWTNNPVLTLFANTVYSLMTDPLNVFTIQLDSLKNNKSIQEWFNTNVQPWFTKEKWLGLGENIKSGISDKWNEFLGNWQNTGAYNWYSNKVAPWFTKEKWLGLGENIKSGISDKWNNFLDKWNLTGASNWYEEKVKPWFTIEKWNSLGKNIKDSIVNKWKEFTDWWSNTGISNWWNNNVTPWFSSEKWNFEGIKTGLKNAWDGAIKAIKEAWNTFANGLNSNLKFTINPIVISGKTVFSGGILNLGQIPTFANGGFPEDGWFRASHGEIMGQFDNGQSVVANNNQITDGISAAVQRGNQQMIGYMQEEIVELRKQNEFLMQIAGKSFGITKEQIGENARSWAMEYTMRTGNEAYSF